MGCGSEEIEAIFSPDDFLTRKEFLSVPFPNPLYIEEDGSIDLPSFFRVRKDSILYDYLSVISKSLWFGLNSGIYFRFNGPVEPSTLSHSIILMDVDRDSGEGGRIYPVIGKFFERRTKYLPENTLAVLPFPGFPLKEGRLYALFITSELKGKGGKKIAKPPIIQNLLEGKCTLEGCSEYSDAINFFEKSVGRKEKILNMTVFRTGYHTKYLQALYGVSKDVVPEVKDVKYMGPNTDERFGMSGKYHLYEISLEVGVFQKGLPPYLENGGNIDFEKGPSLERKEEGRAVLVIPPFPPPEDGYCAVLYAHGTGGDAYSFVQDGSALNITFAGCAGIGIDEILHGRRGRGELEAYLFFNPFNIRAARDNILEAAAELSEFVSFIEKFEMKPAPHGGDIYFNKNEIYYMGHSQGAIIGVPFLGVEERVKSAVISGGGGFLIYSLLHKSMPFQIRPLLELLLGEEIDEFHIMLNLFQTFFEPADSVNYIPFITSTNPKHIFISQGTDDPYTPPETADALLCAGNIPLLEPVIRENIGLRMKGIGSLSPPVRCNIQTERGCITAIGVQFEGYGHYPMFYDKRAFDMWREFLSTSRTGVPEIRESKDNP